MSEDKARAIAEKLKKYISDGKYGADNPLPSVRALMKRHGIARSTANRVLQHLVQTGFAECRIGSGMYPVVKKPITFGVIVPNAQKPFYSRVCAGIANCANSVGGGANTRCYGARRIRRLLLGKYFLLPNCVLPSMCRVFSSNAFLGHLNASC